MLLPNGTFFVYASFSFRRGLGGSTQAFPHKHYTLLFGLQLTARPWHHQKSGYAPGMNTIGGHVREVGFKRVVTGVKVHSTPELVVTLINSSPCLVWHNPSVVRVVRVIVW